MTNTIENTIYQLRRAFGPAKASQASKSDTMNKKKLKRCLMASYVSGVLISLWAMLLPDIRTQAFEMDFWKQVTEGRQLKLEEVSTMTAQETYYFAEIYTESFPGN